MKIFRTTMLIVLILMCLFLTTYGFYGHMPSWMGACGWLGILFSYVGKLTCKTMVDKKAELREK